MTDWLESVYTTISRIGDFLSATYDAITSGIAYISGSVSALFSASLPSEILGVLVLSVGVCIILLILGR